MTSAKKLRTNRANARASTGPKTEQGRARSARNSLRHALSLPVDSDPAVSEDVEALAREIAGTDANVETQELARQVAEAQIDLRRVRYARHQLLLNALRNPYYRVSSKCARESEVPLPSSGAQRTRYPDGSRGEVSDLDAGRTAQVRNNSVGRG